MDKIPNEYDPEWTQIGMDTISNGLDPERARFRLNILTSILCKCNKMYVQRR